MSRQVRLEFPGALFHVTSRGNNKQNIFFDDHDRELYLDLLGMCEKRFGWIIPAYVLMSNHVHLLIQLTIETLSKGLEWLHGQYARSFNRRHGRVGHLFQGPPYAPLIEKQAYYQQVLSYVVLNPVRAGMVRLPEDYRWSSHRAILGMVEAPEWLAVDDVLAEFADDRNLARARYRNFVDAGIGLERTPWRDLVANTFLGTEQWIDGVRDRLKLKPRCDAFPLEQRIAGRTSMSEIVGAVAAALSIDEDVARRGRVPRLIAAWLGREALLTNRQIAAGLRLRSEGHVSRLAKQCEDAATVDPAWRQTLDGALSTVRGKKER
jgi:REP element-mobilizing transposase RayT